MEHIPDLQYQSSGLHNRFKGLSCIKLVCGRGEVGQEEKGMSLQCTSTVVALISPAKFCLTTLKLNLNLV